jgi:hypothetical protein
MLACFAMKPCRRCSLRDQCPTEQRRGRRVLKFSAAAVAVARRRVEQQTSLVKTRHKIRSGIEATSSERLVAAALGRSARARTLARHHIVGWPMVR